MPLFTLAARREITATVPTVTASTFSSTSPVQTELSFSDEIFDVTTNESSGPAAVTLEAVKLEAIQKDTLFHTTTGPVTGELPAEREQPTTTLGTSSPEAQRKLEADEEGVITEELTFSSTSPATESGTETTVKIVDGPSTELAVEDLLTATTTTTVTTDNESDESTTPASSVEEHTSTADDEDPFTTGDISTQGPTTTDTVSTEDVSTPTDTSEASKETTVGEIGSGTSAIFVATDSQPTEDLIEAILSNETTLAGPKPPSEPTEKPKKQSRIAAPPGFTLPDANATVDFEFNKRVECLRRLGATLESLTHFTSSVNCAALFDGDEAAMERASNWTFDGEAFWDETISPRLNETCATIRETFAFFDHPLSDAEQHFPLAFGLLAHGNATQVYFLLSTIYQPQNAFCIAVDGKAAAEFKEKINLLAECFPNIFVLGVGDVERGSYEEVRGIWRCFEHLTELRHPWQYYQHLSDVDLPLKTNLEMVRIFEQFDGAVVTEVGESLVPENVADFLKPPLTIWKSSVSALIGRRTAQHIVRSDKVRQLLTFLKLLNHPAERLWASIVGNPDELPIFGGFDARALIQSVRAEDARKNRTDVLLSPEEPFRVCGRSVGRYQVRNDTDGEVEGKCQGILSDDSCVFGVRDLPRLAQRAEIIAHKLSLDFEPAAFFCLYERVRYRAFDPNQKRFKGEAYAQLPQVQLHKGARIEDVRTDFQCDD
ncbi:Protein GLY-15 a [Aphelenchoides avenae]|nr:Protein GLY-15 a [Aphelenchus avenae]